jgi:hypothetical protein
MCITYHQARERRVGIRFIIWGAGAGAERIVEV